MEPFVRAIPKAELHLHIEGTLEPELMFTLAQRNGVALPFADVAEVKAAYEFTNLQSFLDIYYQGASVLQTERDFYDLAWAYLERAHADHVRHVEAFFDPQTHTGRGVPFETVITGLHEAFEDGYREFGITFGLIMCFLRHLSQDEALETLAEAMNYVEWIVAVGLDSSEVGHPPSKFREVFERAKEGGFLTVAHAGEEGPPGYVWEALDLLGVSRIDHGVRSLEDPALIERLVAERIPLTVCPLSNVRLRVVDRIEDHPLGQMLDLGMVATVNSDDPAYFGGYVADNYEAVRTGLGFDADRIALVARNGFEASFLSQADKEAHMAAVDEFAATHRPEASG